MCVQIWVALKLRNSKGAGSFSFIATESCAKQKAGADEIRFAGECKIFSPSGVWVWTTPPRMIKAACASEYWCYLTVVKSRHRLDTSTASACSWKSCPVKALIDAQRWARAQSLSWGHSNVITHRWRGGRSQARLRQWYKACMTYWCRDNAQCRRHTSPFYSQKRCSEQPQQAISAKRPSQSSLLSMAFHKRWRVCVQLWAALKLHECTNSNWPCKCDVTAPNKLFLGHRYEWIHRTGFRFKRMIVQKSNMGFKNLKRMDKGSLGFTLIMAEVCWESAVSEIFATTTSGLRDVSRCM